VQELSASKKVGVPKKNGRRHEDFSRAREE